MGKLGYKHTEESLERMKVSATGRKHSKETIEKIKKNHKGGSLGKNWKLSDKTKKIMSDTAKNTINHSGRFKRGHDTRIGMRNSEEQRLSISGDRNWNWKGGITPENQKIRESLEYKLWREAVFTRDNYTCQKCGNNEGGNLNSHHIKNFAECKELRVAINNGITFCEDCHHKFHRIFGRINNNEKQVNKFLSLNI